MPFPWEAQNVFWVLTRLKVRRACTYLYSALEFLYRVSFEHTWYWCCTCSLIEKDSFWNLFFCKFSLRISRKIRIQAELTFISPVFHSGQCFRHAGMLLDNSYFWEPLSPTIIQFRYNLGQVIKAGLCVYSCLQSSTLRRSPKTSSSSHTN